MTIRLKTFTGKANAGDAASQFIVEKILGTEVEVWSQANANGPNLIALGSILQWADQHSVIWGSGYINTKVSPSELPAHILAVRGPLTRERLHTQGFSGDFILGDPGVLLPEFLPASLSKSTLGLIPHYVDMDEPFVGRALAAGVCVIDPSLPLADYTAKLTSCNAILSSSLHGIIFAHAYGIPAGWIELSDRVIGDGFKFRDYYASVGISSNDIQSLDASASFERMAEACHLPPSQIDATALRAALVSNRGLLNRD